MASSGVSHDLFDGWLLDEPEVVPAKSRRRATPKTTEVGKVAPSRIERKPKAQAMMGADDVLQVDESAMALWQRCLVELSYQIAESELKQWLEPLKPQIAGDTLTLYAINQVFLRRCAKYVPIIEQVLAQYGDGVHRVALKKEILKSTPIAPVVAKRPSSISLEGDAIKDSYVFENFVKGKSNTLAYNACLEMAKQAGQKGGNSLFFIYGASGLGKTHLMHAVAHRYQKAGLEYCYFTKDGFFRAMTGAMVKKGEAGNLLKRISKADLLIIDDVHLINNQSGPQVSQTLITLCDEFTQGNKRLILASNKPPSLMENFEERFLSRFSGGLTLPIEPPDIETRVQILQKKAHMLGVELPKDCALFIAQNIPSDVRSLEGALNQVVASTQLYGQQINLELAKVALKDRIESKARAVNAENIRSVVSEYYGVSLKDLMSKKRARPIARPRQMAMALIRELTQDSFPEIGQGFGGRDHTTVIHACEAIAKLRQSDADIEKDYQALMATLKFS